MSKLQDIAREHNWVRNFMYKLLPTTCRYIHMSARTKHCIKQANMYIQEARSSLTEDWKRQRAEELSKRTMKKLEEHPDRLPF